MVHSRGKIEQGRKNWYWGVGWEMAWGPGLHVHSSCSIKVLIAALGLTSSRHSMPRRHNTGFCLIVSSKKWVTFPTSHAAKVDLIVLLEIGVQAHVSVNPKGDGRDMLEWEHSVFSPWSWRRTRHHQLFSCLKKKNDVLWQGISWWA